MKDLDQSDVNADAARMYEEEMEKIGEELEGADLYSVLRMIADAEDGGMEFKTFLDTSILARDLIQYTQSNPTRSYEVLIRLAELDDAIAEL